MFGINRCQVIADNSRWGTTEELRELPARHSYFIKKFSFFYFDVQLAQKNSKTSKMSKSKSNPNPKSQENSNPNPIQIQQKMVNPVDLNLRFFCGGAASKTF